MSREQICLILMTLMISAPWLTIREAHAATLQVTVTTNKAVYDPGEDVVITIMVRRLVGDMLLPVDGASVLVSIEPPGGGIAAFPAPATGMISGEYRYTHHLAGSAAGGLYKVTAHAEKGADSGSKQTTFTVSGAPGKKTVDWLLYNPSITPAYPTADDPVSLNVWLRIAATISPGPYPVDIVCSVDGVLADAGTLVISGTSPLHVSTDPKKYPAGTHTATWVVDPNYEYNDPNTGNNQVTFTFTVGPPAPPFDFSVSANPPSLTIKAGETATFTTTASLVSGLPANTALTLTGLPAGATYTFNPPAGSPSFTSVLTITTASTVTPGSYVLSITGTSGSLSRTATATLLIQSPVEADFELSIIPASQGVAPKQSTSFVVSVTGKGGFESTVGLAVSGLPQGVQAAFSPLSGAPDYTSTLTLTASEAAQAGTHVLTIYASGGGKTKSTAVTLVIQAAATPEATRTTQPPSQDIETLIGQILGQPYLLVIAALLLVIVVLAARSRRPTTSN
ncbi:hypothetical protein KEJ39_08235 [Candidatus Bathyarchaeota archaeon]|nr:hypothetical protein [Candidatus Bathyarchaeota archaeon]